MVMEVKKNGLLGDFKVIRGFILGVGSLGMKRCYGYG